MLPGVRPCCRGSPLLPGLAPAAGRPDAAVHLGPGARRSRRRLDAGVPKLAVIHFDNCFNMSAEVLYTVAPYAEYATGYPNYNFFTAGEGYPAVFTQLAQQGNGDAQELARAFAKGSNEDPRSQGNHRRSAAPCGSRA